MFFQVLWYNLDSSLKAVSGTWGRNVNLMTQKEGIQKGGKGPQNQGLGKEPTQPLGLGV